MDIQSFTSKIADELQAAGYTVKTDGDAVCTVSLAKDIKSHINLRNFYTRYLQGDPLEQIISVIVKVMEHTLQQHKPLDWENAMDKLRTHIIPTSQFQKDFIGRPISPLLSEVLIIDEPEYIRYATQRDVEMMNKNLDDLWLTAEFNMLTTAPQPQTLTTSGLSTVHFWNCLFGATHAWRWALRQPFVAVALIHRDLGVCVNEPTEEDLQLLAVYAAEKSEEPTPYALTPMVHIMRDGKAIGFMGATRVDRT